MSVFNSELFSVSNLTASINQQENPPGRLGELGLFQESGMTTTVATIEKKKGKLQLVKNKPRGSIGQTTEKDSRSIIPIKATHLPQLDSVMADEVQGVRAFGTENQLEAVQSVIDEKLSRMQRNIDATLEYHRAGVLQGKILDSDGEVILDLFQEFQLKKIKRKPDFVNGNLKNESREWRRISKRELGATMVRGFRAFCGVEFYNELIAAEETARAWERYNDGEMLRNDPKGAFLYAGLLWEEYDASLGDKYIIPEKKAYLVPEGVADLFLTRFAPADYMSAVNTIGLPYYSSSVLLDHDKGVELESQSNPLSICTVPSAIIELEL